MINALSPVNNPLGYMILTFVSAVVSSDYVQVFYLAVITSVACFPFALIGLALHKRLNGKKKSGSFSALKTTAIMVVLFWLATRVWYIITGFGFPNLDVATFVASLVISVVMAFVFVLFGKWLDEKVKERYDVPYYLNAYLLCLASSLLFFLASTVAFMLNYGLVFQ